MLCARGRATGKNREAWSPNKKSELDGVFEHKMLNIIMDRGSQILLLWKNCINGY